MKKNKFLVLVQNSEIISYLRELNVNLAFPLKFFSVGFTKYFSIDEIAENDYIYINKLLDNNDLVLLADILHQKKFKGIIFDDLGVLEITKDLDIEKILYMPHQLANTLSVNYMLEYVDSIILSTDLTKEEIKIIISNSIKKLCIFGFGHTSVLYSQRNLIKNYYNHYDLDDNKLLNISVNNKELIGIESLDGTVFYDDPCIKNFEFNDCDKVRYVFINTVFLKNEDILELINSSDTKEKYYDGFLYKETIYKLKDGE